MADLSPDVPPPATLSIHRDYLQPASPDWLINTTSSRRAELKTAAVPLPGWYTGATPGQRQTLHEKFNASLSAQTALDKAMAPVQGIDTFAEPLLVKALQDQFKVQLDVNTTLLQLRTRVEYLQPQATYVTFEVLRLPLLQAVLHNFEESECKEGAFDASSGFVVATAKAGTFEAVNTSLTVAQFTGLCRSLDIGAQYQRYLNDFMHPKDSATEQALRHTFSAARKADLAAAAEQALLTQAIGPDDYTMITSVINGENHPWMGKRQVWFRDLGLMRKRMTGCVAFVICEKYRYTTDLILYIPHDPHHPLKRVTWDQMQAIFKARFTARDTPDPDDGNPTAYQRFFSRFVRYADLPTYFGALIEITPAPGTITGLKVYSPFMSHFLRGIDPFSVLFKTVDVPPNPEPNRRLNLTPFLQPTTMNQVGRIGWESNLDLWDYLFDQHRDKLLADARSHAVPTADVDARVRSEKFAKLLGIGLLALNVVSMFVPVLGEVMMAVMAGQLLYETFAGSVEWAEGDRHAAKAHLVDVAENLAFIAVMAAVGKGFSTLAAAKPEAVIENLSAVTLPNGQTRLWKPDLKGYESTAPLPANLEPNAQGQFLQGGKTYIRQEGKLYETTFDESLKRWRIQHPTDPTAYQPPLSHNGSGAWRHTLEQPQTWDRLTLMRRLGPVTERFSDEQLLQIADVSGTRDETLRKMHLDNTPPPAALADTLRLFKADQDVAHVIEQVSTGQAVDGRYLYALPLLTEMPRWPIGRVLEVFDQPGLSGPSVRYGVERLYHGVKLKAPIRISRADVLSSQLPAHILAALEEPEIVAMLGGEGARLVENRPHVLRTQLADYARTRQPALFDSLYKGTELSDPTVAKLQRMYPGLSKHAAQSVLTEADAEQLHRLRSTGRVPLAMQEHARWQVREGRLGHAFAGLHMENLTSADSKRLALHTLSNLPGWSDQLRLEVREGAVSGALLDAIGSATASQRKFLVKRGPVYQAFDERGEALNSLTAHGDNFYASLMHAMPDEARQALGMPQVWQSADLRRAIIDYASEHRLESAQRVAPSTPGRIGFKPPQRISSTLVGYPASGRGHGASPSLVSRVQDVYPQLTDGQANGFILAQMLADKTETQIFSLLNTLQREWDTLDATLSAWMNAPSTDSFTQRYPQMDSRPGTVQALKTCWRNAPLAELPGLARLNLMGEVALPPLSANFAHVRTLSVRGRGMLEGHVEQLLGYFPQVRELSLAGAETTASAVPEALDGLHDLTRLNIQTAADLAEPVLTRLEGMSRLEHLSVHASSWVPRPLVVSRLSNLRELVLSGEGLRDFPQGVFELPHLRRLDLKGSGIDTLAPELFEPGREHIWAGLSMTWSRFTRERFKYAYDFVREQPGHLMDQDEMVRDYCTGQLNEGLGRARFSHLATDGQLAMLFFRRWATSQEQFAAIEVLSDEYAELSASLDRWLAPDAQRLELSSRVDIAYTLRVTWNQGLLQRYGIRQHTALNLPGMMVSELPRLPAAAFDHVTVLRLQNTRVSGQSLSGFIRGFAGLQTLDASGCRLTELLLAPGEWPVLKHLDLHDNPLERLDVSSLNQLEALNLGATALTAWPAGAERLPHLNWLDLRGTRISELPPTVLATDRLLLDTHLAGTTLSPQGQADLAAARQRIEQTLGMDDGTLARFEQQPIRDAFPPDESGSRIARQLLPVPTTNPVEASLTRRLNSWLYQRQYAPRYDLMVSSGTRQIAAQRILNSWRNGLSAVVEGEARELNFHGLVLGDLPELPVTLAHIERLNLNGVQLSGEGSNGFLRAFPQVSTLVLSSNPLMRVPQAVVGMARLERLELSAIDLSDSEFLHASLMRLGQLRWLDVSYCGLDSFGVEQFERLESLNLSNNELTGWPEGVLRAGSLRTLDLSSNQLESIPPGVLEGGHDELIAGTDISDNFGLPLDDLYRLQAHARRVASDTVMGWSSADVQQMINDREYSELSESASESEAPVLPDEVIVTEQTTPLNREPWLKNLPASEQAQHIELWEQLAHEPGNVAFFNLLSLLPQTKEFEAARASLTARVWRVMEAAGSDEALRQTLFGMSNTHGTCTDGRILTFSGLEIKVLEFDTLRGIDPTDLTRKGPALLTLSRNLFRLEQVEKLAGKQIRPGLDAAEVRLQYLIGLRRRLDLQGVPEKMRFAIPISGPTMEQGARAIEALERTEVFYQDLISRDYWVDYLKERYPEDFAALEQRNTQHREALEDRFSSVDDPGYLTGLETLDHQLQADETQTLIALSRRADEALDPLKHDPDQPGTSTGSTA